MTVNVRAMKPDDIDQVYTIEIAAYSSPWSRDILRDCVRVRYDCRVIELEGEMGKKIVGYLICRYPLNTCHILNLCVAPSSEGRGYAQLLLQHLFNSLENTALEAVFLEVRPSNERAIYLYKKNGFQQVGIKRGYYRDANNKEDAIVLKKALSNKPEAS